MSGWTLEWCRHSIDPARSAPPLPLPLAPSRGLSLLGHGARPGLHTQIAPAGWTCIEVLSHRPRTGQVALLRALICQPSGPWEPPLSLPGVTLCLHQPALSAAVPVLSPGLAASVLLEGVIVRRRRRCWVSWHMHGLILVRAPLSSGRHRILQRLPTLPVAAGREQWRAAADVETWPTTDPSQQDSRKAPALAFCREMRFPGRQGSRRQPALV